MKLRLFSLFIAIISLSTLLIACNPEHQHGDESSDPQQTNDSPSFDKIDFSKITLDIAGICAEMSTKLTLDDELFPVDSSVAESNYQISDLYDEISCYCSSLATAETVCIVKSENSEKANTVKEQISKYAQKMSATYASYNMTESEKLANAYINTFGNYTVFFVSVDSSEAFELFKSAVLDRVPV